MTKIAIAAAHGHTPKWLQILIHSLKQTQNEVQSDIYIAETWPGHPSVKAITETDLGKDVTVIQCQRRKHSHSTALEEILEYVWDMDYDYFFATETDCRAVKNGWLDWYLNFVKDDPKKAIAGYFWHEGDHHYNINPSATLYRMDMLKQYHVEARENNDNVFYHPKGNKLDTEPGMDPSIKELVGCFAETRGIKNPTPQQLDVIVKGIPHPSWWEPGAWVYARLQGEWNEVRVPTEHVNIQIVPGHTAPEGTYYGSKADPCFIHYWGGTRCYDFLKHPVECNFVKSCTPAWIKREDTLWKQFVPEEYRSIVHAIQIEAEVEQKMKQNLGIFVPEVL